jgi:hypothetical protein
MRLTLILVVLAAVLAAYLLLRSSSPLPTPALEPAQIVAATASPMPPAAESAAPVRVAGSTPPVATATDAPPGTATLAVGVVDSKGAPVFRATVLLLRPRAAGTTRIPSADTDPEGFAELVVPSGQTVTIEGGRHGETTRTQIDVEPLAPGEVREVAIVVTERASTAREVLVRARAADGTPIEGATLHTSREAGFSTGGSPWIVPPRTAATAVTDALGEARVQTEALATTVSLVRATGFAPQIVTLRGAAITDVPLSTVEVTLTPAARAEGLVTGAPAGARARAVTPAYALQPHANRGELLGSDVRFEAEVGSDGTFALEDLATGAPLRFELAHEKRLLVVEPDAILLGAGEDKRLEWRVGAGAVARCIVREEDGALASGIGVWLLSSDEGRPGLAEGYWTPAQRRRTDENGTATFDPVQGGAWVVALEPLERPKPADQAYAPIAVRVDLSDETKAITIELTLTRARYIRGVVVDPAGAPLSAHLTGHGPGGIFLSENSTADGAFTCGPLVPGTYELTAKMHHAPVGEASYGPSVPVKAEAGTEGVELRLEPGGALTVTASLGGEPRSAKFTATGTSALSAQGFGGKATLERRFVGLGLGTYVVTATTDDGLIGILPQFALAAPGDQTVDVPLEASGTVRIRNNGPHRYLNCNVTHGDTYIFAGTAMAGGDEVFHLPPGPARVRLNAYDHTSTEVPIPKIYEETREVVVVAREEVVIDVTR